jgi:hypothetical protein
MEQKTMILKPRNQEEKDTYHKFSFEEANLESELEIIRGQEGYGGEGIEKDWNNTHQK